MELKPNTRYKVTRFGAHLHYAEPVGRGCRPTSHPLQIGDIITFQGNTGDAGGDHARLPLFRMGDITGEFRPNFWGMIDPTYLTEVNDD